MMTKDEALKMAIEWVEGWKGIAPSKIELLRVLREALEQPAQEPLTSLDEIFADEMFRLNRDIMPLPEHLIHEIAQRNYHPALGINPVAFTLDIEKAHGIGEQACKEALAQPLTRDWKETIDERVAKDDAFKQALEQPAQEPVGYIVPDYQNVMHARDGHTLMAQEKTDLHKIPVYTHPAPVWQGLSDDEIDDVKTKAIMGANGMSVEQLLGLIVSLTEQALKEKNT